MVVLRIRNTAVGKPGSKLSLFIINIITKYLFNFTTLNGDL